MRLRPAILIITTICGVLSAQFVCANDREQPQQQVSVGEWFSFAPKGAPFSVTLPAMPIEKGKALESRMKVRTYALKALLSEYVVVWGTGLPVESSAHGSLDSLFPVAFNEMLDLASANGGRFEEEYEKELNLDGNCGREAKMRTLPPTGNEVWARGYIAGSDFVALIVLYPREDEASGEAKRFFDSLTLPRTGKEGSAVDDSERGSDPGTERSGKVDSDPVPLSLPKPNYTESAHTHRVQGPVRLRVLVDRNGEVREIRVVSHLPDGLDQEAIKSVRALKFMPAMADGQSVPGWMSMVVNFRWAR
ncbi:MAG TPA: energy transducer TonB [Blastocatellia bacterium]|nr:energy transducer TonB [Blastocatellia bacterium]